MNSFVPVPEALDRYARAAVNAALTVHRELGPGLLESVYETCLCHELRECGLEVKRQVAIPILYKGQLLDNGYRADLIIEDCVLIELKAVEKILPVHEAQILSYLRLGGYRLGFLMNFALPRMADGIKRFVI
jgi:GxxExxY protein